MSEFKAGLYNPDIFSVNLTVINVVKVEEWKIEGY